MYGQFENRPECDHDWEKWEERAQTGLTVILYGHQRGNVCYFDNQWQTRVCKKCGVRQNTPEQR